MTVKEQGYSMILMNDFGAEPAELRSAMKTAAARVVDSAHFILGKENAAFERRWAAACRMSHAVGVANGMDAIEIALRALRIGPGDEVITTPMTAFATVLAIHRAGAVPVLADVDPATALLCPDSVERCLTARTKAVIPVHLYGQIRNMDRWVSLCRGAGVALIEDCAQSHLAEIDGRVAGSFGAAGAYSFYPTKNLGALGDAGAVVTDDPALAELCAKLRNYGQSERYHHPELGLNSRLDEMQAAILAVRLDYLAGFTARRQAIAARYHDELNNDRVQLLSRPAAPGAHVYHLFVVTCDERDALQQHLKDEGVQALIHYPVLVSQQAPFRTLRRDPNGLGHSERHAATCLSLPCHPQMSDAQVSTVIEAVNRFGR